MNMTSERICPECGAALEPGTPGDGCPACMFGLALNAPLLDERGGAARRIFSESPGKPRQPELAIFSPDRRAIPTDEIPGYSLIEPIGHGGCGVVWLAEQERPVRRRVALKVIKVGMDTEQVVARFDAERQVLASMDHPNIAKVLDAGATAAGRPYFAMELVSGLKITEFCDQNGVTTTERLKLFIQVCRAIQHAHQKGVIHRDITPSNVLVAQQDAVAVPKVIDFGIAKATQGRLIDHTVFTAYEQFLGTPVYMSPEQAGLGGLDVDTRTDIYSLGVLLYELLTGKPPFDFGSSKLSGSEVVRRTLLEKEALRPSTRLNSMPVEQSAAIARARQTDASKLCNLLRGDLDWIVMRCLEKDRARRYETANGLALDLERYLASEPVLARPPSAGYRFRKFIARNRVAAFSAAAISASLILGTVLSSWLAIKATRAERQQRALRFEAQAAKQQATEQLWASCLAEARARRLSREAGASFESLAAIAKAAAIRPAIELRNEAIASLAQTDIRSLKRKRFGLHSRVLTDPSASCYVLHERSGAVRVCRVSDDKELAVIPEMDSACNGLWLFTANPPLLALGYNDDLARVWDWQRAVCLLQIPSPQGMDFSPDGTKLAVLLRDRVSFFNIPSQPSSSAPGSLQGTQLDPGGWALRFSPDGQLLAAFNELHPAVVIVDVQSGKVVHRLPHPDGVRRVAWSPDGKYLASSCLDNFIHLWIIPAGKEFQRLPANQGVGLAFSPDSSLLAVSGWDGRTRLWDYSNARQLVSIYKSGEMLGFAPDGRSLVEISWEGHDLDRFEIANPNVLHTLNTHQSDPRGPAGNAVFSHNSQLLAFGCADGVRVWDARQRQIGLVSNNQAALIGFDAHDQHLILADEQGLLLYPFVAASGPKDGSESDAAAALDLEHAQRPALDLVGRGGILSLDGQHCCLIGNNRCEIVNIATFHDPVVTGVHPGARFLAANPDASLVATGAWLSPAVIVWDGRTGKKVKTLETPDTTSVAFSPDGKFLVTGSAERYTFWRVGPWTEALSIPQQDQNDFVPMMAFSGDGRLFAGTHSRRIVRLYDAATGQVLADFEPPDPHTVTGLCLSADGSSLAVCEGYESQRLWDLQAIRSRLAPLGLDWNLATPYSSAR